MNDQDDKWLESLSASGPGVTRSAYEEALREVLLNYARQDDLSPAQKADLFERVRGASASRRRPWLPTVPAAAAASTALVGIGVVLTLSMQLPNESADFQYQPRYREAPLEAGPEKPLADITPRALKRFLVDQDLPYRLSRDNGSGHAEVYIGLEPSTEVLRFFSKLGVAPDAYGWVRFDIKR